MNKILLAKKGRKGLGVDVVAPVLLGEGWNKLSDEQKQAYEKLYNANLEFFDSLYESKKAELYRLIFNNPINNLSSSIEEEIVLPKGIDNNFTATPPSISSLTKPKLRSRKSSNRKQQVSTKVNKQTSNKSNISNKSTNKRSFNLIDLNTFEMTNSDGTLTLLFPQLVNGMIYHTWTNNGIKYGYNPLDNKTYKLTTTKKVIKKPIFNPSNNSSSMKKSGVDFALPYRLVFK